MNMIPGFHGEGQRTDAARLARADHLDDSSVDVCPQLHNAGVGCRHTSTSGWSPDSASPMYSAPWLSELRRGLDSRRRAQRSCLSDAAYCSRRVCRRGRQTCARRSRLQATRSPAPRSQKVGHHEPVTLVGDESGADQLRKRVGNGAVEQLDRIKISGPHQASGLSQVW